MDRFARAISGYGTRLKWLRQELARDIAVQTTSISRNRRIVVWYLQQGYAMGMQRAHLELMLSDQPQLLAIAKTLSAEEISAGKPPPQFNHGDGVEVIVNAKNVTHHKGHVRSIQWHYKERRWFYLLTDNQGKNVSKRYWGSDLRRIRD